MIVCRAVSHGASLGEWGTYGHDERISKTRGAVGDLVAELDVVVVKPATGDGGKATVEAGNARLSEETGQDVANDATNGVRREDLCKGSVSCHSLCRGVVQEKRTSRQSS